MITFIHRFCYFCHFPPKLTTRSLTGFPTVNRQMTLLKKMSNPQVRGAVQGPLSPLRQPAFPIVLMNLNRVGTVPFLLCRSDRADSLSSWQSREREEREEREERGRRGRKGRREGGACEFRQTCPLFLCGARCSG